ncbi:MAG: bifunctional serine/threonine-protein kinase/formylglycine-generating enzyme family protein [Nannocystaceae bacterium]
MVGARDGPPGREVESASPVSSGGGAVEDWSPPEEFDEYRLVRPLGRGSMGQVFLAQDRVLDRPVAIKFISSLHASSTERERFLVEARAAARLHHPNIMAIYRVGELEGNPYLVCEYIHGKSLSELDLPVSWQQAHKMAIGLSRGLSNAHRHGVLHRDVKLANVMVDELGEVKILDFSLAKLIREQGKGKRGSRGKRSRRSRQKGSFPATGAPIREYDEESSATANDAGEPPDVERARTRYEVDDDAAEAAAETVDGGGVEPATAAPQPEVNPSTRVEANALPTEVVARIDALDEQWHEETMLARLGNLAEASPVADTARGDRNVIQRAAWIDDSQRSASLTQVGALMGTPHYMAPELWHGEPASRASDVYAAGVVFYALVTGRTPYAGLSLTELAAAILEGKYRPLQEVAPSCDARFASIIERCLKLHPAERYASGDELRSALEILTPIGQSLQVPSGNPYRGLQAFQAEHRSLFFGRSVEIRAVVERLRSDAFVLVAGDSGVGKSSLCRAGVVPLIQDGGIEPERTWTSVAMMPGRKPLQVLISVLAEYLDVDEETLHAMILESAVTFGWYLRKQLGAGRGLIIFIDQLEELVTISDKEQAALVGAVLSQISAGIPGVRLMASARGDFLTRVAEIPELGEEISRAIYLLRPLTREGAREAISGPAELQGVRFENDELVDELIDAGVEGSLPLLQFALAELWNVRDEEAGVITRADLEQIGGVTGALARHGDGVLASLLPQARTEARRILVRLVTIEDTRANLTEDELTGENVEAQTALEALVRSRLLVVRETADGIIYEIAHEALISGWGTLRSWLDEEREGRILLHSLETAASEWERLGKPRDALWGTAALTRASLYLDESSLRPREREFLTASRRAVARGRQLRRAALVAIPLVLASVYGVVKINEYRAVQARVAEKMSAAATHLSAAETRRDELMTLRSRAFEAFDSKRRDEAEETWAEALALAPVVDRELKDALQNVEGALILSPGNEEAHESLARALYERAILAELLNEDKQVAELRERLALYDDDGKYEAMWNEPAELRVVLPDVEATLASYTIAEAGEYSLGEAAAIETAGGWQPLSPGSYLMVLRRGETEVRYPLVARRGERLEVSFPFPEAGSIPDSYVYIPPGRFLYGCDADEALRTSFFYAAPLHSVTTSAYLIGQYEVTFGEWIEFLDASAADTRAQNTPKAEQISLVEAAPRSWELHVLFGEEEMVLKQGQPMVYETRKAAREQDWQRWPVLGVSFNQAQAYTNWLSDSGKLVGAHVCTGWEWERAARGADGRHYPHGDRLGGADANIDQTYGAPEARGPDTVGLHMPSASPFGVEDMTGNAAEWSVSSLVDDEYVLRGGGFYYDAIMALAYNRPLVPPFFREWQTGVRVCAPLHVR